MPCLLVQEAQASASHILFLTICAGLHARGLQGCRLGACQLCGSASTRIYRISFLCPILMSSQHHFANLCNANLHAAISLRRNYRKETSARCSAFTVLYTTDAEAAKDEDHTDDCYGPCCGSMHPCLSAERCTT